MSRLHLPTPSGPCRFRETAMLLVDRELDPAEREAFEAHLPTCPACRKAAAEAERLSETLKLWDHERHARVEAPTRLGLEIRHAVEEIGRRRQLERRHRVLTQLAAAASILLVLAGSILLGLDRRTRAGDGALRADLPTRGVGGPLLEGEAPRLDLARSPVAPPPAPEALRALPTDAPSLASLDPVERGFAKVALVHLEICRRYTDRTVADFARRVGEPAILQTDHRGRMVFLSQGALQFIQDVSGAGNLEGFLLDLAERDSGRLPGHEYADQQEHEDTGLIVADVLPLPRNPEPLKQRLTTENLVGAEGGLRFRALKTEAAAAGGEVLDLEQAVQTGRVVLRPGTGDDLVLIVEGLEVPVFLPRGELIRGGSVDRVVARPTWIPARKAKERFIVPCFPVSSVLAPRPFRPAGIVAGPELRRVLATEGVDREDVLTTAMRMSPDTGVAYSLLDLYDDAGLRRLVKARARQIHRLGWQGFVVSDGEDQLEGIEHTALPRKAASMLLARLWIGYVVEAMATLAVRHDEDVEPLSVTLANLMAYEGTFQASVQRGGPFRESRLRDVHSGVLVDLYEARPTGQPILVSALP